MAERATPRLPLGRGLAAGLTLAALLALVSLAGPLLQRADPRRQIDPAFAGHRPPGSRFQVVELADGRTLAAERIVREGDALRLLGRPEPLELPLDQVAGDPASAVRSVAFWLGTDRFGRDLGARLLAGGRVSLSIALLAVTVTLLVGVPIGLMTGLAGPRVDRLALALIEGAQAFPRLFLLVVLAAAIPAGVLPVVLLLGLTGWMPVARLVRAEVRALTEREYILAARAIGVGPLRLALRHLLPNALTPVAIEGSLGVASAIVAESTLSFLGLGLPPPSASWGGMIAEGRDVLASCWWVSVLPGLALAAAALAFNLIGEGVRDRLDPRARRLAG